MLILGRIYWFASWLVIAAILAVILVMALRLIANQLDINPFSWNARTIRRLSDPFIDPVRRVLARFGVDPKYSPLVVILLVVLVGWFALQLVTSIANTIGGLLFSVSSGSLPATIGYVL